jgi:hypothetical protein
MRLKPVIGPFECIEKVAWTFIPAIQPRPKVAGSRLAMTILCEIRNWSCIAATLGMISQSKLCLKCGHRL